MAFSPENWRPRHQKNETFFPGTQEYLEQQVDSLVSASLSFAPVLSEFDFKTIDWRRLNEEDIPVGCTLLVTAESIAQSIEADMAYPIYTQHPITNPESISVAKQHNDTLSSLGLFSPLHTPHSVESRTYFSAEESTPQVTVLALKELIALRLEQHPIDRTTELVQIEPDLEAHVPIYTTPLTSDLSLQVIFHKRRKNSADRLITTNNGTFVFGLQAVDSHEIFADRLQSDFVKEEQHVIGEQFIFRKEYEPGFYYTDQKTILAETIVLQYQTAQECIEAFQLAHEDFKNITPETHEEEFDHFLRLESNDELYHLAFSWNDTDKTFNVVATRTEKFFEYVHEKQKAIVQHDLPELLVQRLHASRDQATHQFRYPYAVDSGRMPSVYMGKLPWDMINAEVRALFPLDTEVAQWIKQQEQIGVTEKTISPVFESEVAIHESTLHIGWRVVFEMPLISSSEDAQRYEPQVYCWNSST